MHDYSFYSAILGLSSKWRIWNVTDGGPDGHIELQIRSRKGSMFSCPVCGALKSPTRVSESRWLHENKLNISFYISALIPVITCEKCGDSIVELGFKTQGSLRRDETHCCAISKEEP